MPCLSKVAGAKTVAQSELSHAVSPLEELPKGHQYIEVQYAQYWARPHQQQIVYSLHTLFSANAHVMDQIIKGDARRSAVIPACERQVVCNADRDILLRRHARHPMREPCTMTGMASAPIMQQVTLTVRRAWSKLWELQEEPGAHEEPPKAIHAGLQSHHSCHIRAQHSHRLLDWPWQNG